MERSTRPGHPAPPEATTAPSAGEPATQPPGHPAATICRIAHRIFVFGTLKHGFCNFHFNRGLRPPPETLAIRFQIEPRENT
jgi:hypothetical protein